MKISLSWVFDHLINASLDTIAINELVERFIQTTAEIEEVIKIELPLDTARLVKVVTCTDTVVEVQDERSQLIKIGMRPNVVVGSLYLIIEDKNKYRWATHTDFLSQKDGLLPEFYHDQSKLDWRSLIEKHDYVLTIDNKSITHRPDLWSHRGIAREIGALYGMELKPLSLFLKELPERFVSYKNSLSISIEASSVCSRVSSYEIDNIKPFASLLPIAQRLARVDVRVINGLVDLTNYVMLDIGQPMHAFNADAFEGKQLTIRFAQIKEKITLLDETSIELTPSDLVIADGAKPLSLAGVMGGKQSAVTENTTHVYLESASFDVATVRKTAVNHKKRTESSARFEKNLDPQQTTYAIERYLKLLNDFNIEHTGSNAVISSGSLVNASAIIIEHAMIEKRIGVSLSSDFIVQILSSLEFKIKFNKDNKFYTITVPSFRATKDIIIKEDIIEEIARFFGYNNIPLTIPLLPTKVRVNGLVQQVHNVKYYLAYACHMKEVYNYGLFDELFLQKIRYEPNNSIQIKNPMSEHWQRLVTSLIPHLIKNITTNISHENQLAFFEYGTIWRNGLKIVEKKSLAGIFYQRKQKIDFFECKKYLTGLFSLLGLSTTWHLIETVDKPWYRPLSTAVIQHNSVVIGNAGFLDTRLLIEPLEGDAFVFELDAEYLLNYHAPIKQIEPLLKYPEVLRDISVLLPMHITVDQLVSRISHLDKRIKKVLLMDLYYKKEWADKKAVTMRLHISDATKTLIKAEVDEIMQLVENDLINDGATIR